MPAIGNNILKSSNLHLTFGYGPRTFVSGAPTYAVRRMRHNRVGAPGNDRKIGLADRNCCMAYYKPM
ncbi:MAG: hypothetical protein GDA48_01335 [Hormoscilla sp. GM102CHS1]|nr:hypothetical protein [Hormoscilla sp. GM102CHS1]